MVGRRTAKDTAKLIDEVARGDRLLEDIKDPQLRETVRLALRLHKDPYTAPDARTRSRIRARVLLAAPAQRHARRSSRDRIRAARPTDAVRDARSRRWSRYRR